jgi:small GTP-binding protein
MLSGPSAPARYKVILLGNVGVGKTCLANRQCHLPFRADQRPSIGVLKLRTCARARGADVHLEVWDTAGQEQYLSLVPMYARGASVCILVCSAADPDSVPGMDHWLAQARAADTAIPVIVAANKADLADGPAEIDALRARLLARFPDVFCCSALRGDGVEELFAAAAEKCEALKRPTLQAAPVAAAVSEPPPPGGCC